MRFLISILFLIVIVVLISVPSAFAEKDNDCWFIFCWFQDLFKSMEPKSQCADKFEKLIDLGLDSKNFAIYSTELQQYNEQAGRLLFDFIKQKCAINPAEWRDNLDIKYRMYFDQVDFSYFPSVQEFLEQFDTYEDLRNYLENLPEPEPEPTLENFEMPELYQFPADSVFGVDYNKDIAHLEPGICKNVNVSIHHDLGLYEVAFDSLVQSQTQSNLDKLHEKIERLDSLVQFGKDKDCEILIPQFYLDWQKQH